MPGYQFPPGHPWHGRQVSDAEMLAAMARAQQSPQQALYQAPPFPQAAFPGDPGQYRAPLQPPDSLWYMRQAGVIWARTRFWDPEPWFPYGENGSIAHVPRDRIVSLVSGAAGTEATVPVTFDSRCVVYAVSGSACFVNTATALPVGWNFLQTFLVQLVYAQKENLQDIAGIAEAIIGTAQRPRRVPGNGWIMDNGTRLLCNLTPLFAGLRINVCLHIAETRGPSNVAV